jgi:hypothetical protein
MTETVGLAEMSSRSAERRRGEPGVSMTWVFRQGSSGRSHRALRLRHV